MKAQFAHFNFNVLDLEKSIDFYQKALGFTVEKRKTYQDGAFELAYLGDGSTGFLLELTWLRDHKEPYRLGENEIHLAVRVPDKKEAYRLHKEMGCVCFENPGMDLYFISDPDGYWIEIIG